MTSPVWHPFFQHGLEEAIPHVVRADGAVLHLADGGSLIDGISSWWVTTHGHCHPRIAAAIAAQAHQLDQLIFAGYTHEPAEQVAQGLINLAPRSADRDPLAHVFYSDSGSTAVEVALKMALGYWHNLALDGLAEARHRILVLQHSYHGDTIGAMSVGERGVYNAAWSPLARFPFLMQGRSRRRLMRWKQPARKSLPPSSSNR
jgi:adenosylmethionine-8-amino-7-oxononanoate aminotransferase